MKESIDKIVQEGDWEFAKLLKLNDVCIDLAKNYYNSLDATSILELVWDIQIDEGGRTLGQIISMECRNIIKGEFMTSFQKCFETATVSFKSPAKDESPEPPIDIEQPPLPKPKAKKSDKKQEMVESDDGTKMPKGVKRI